MSDFVVGLALAKEQVPTELTEGRTTVTLQKHQISTMYLQNHKVNICINAPDILLHF